ncbi:uncharacterized protein LOC108477486 [Gossypium arboreum]|uniref:uncharacterized protein LOC108477486 n=1 Tax=Gossypium arboreum TaxID=29729 RepID=UPI0008193370|nr:uncharacterized protein LOC108477486 [Gossypium arboreum]
MVATEYEQCIRFEDGLRDNLRFLIAPQRERDFLHWLRRRRSSRRLSALRAKTVTEREVGTRGIRSALVLCIGLRKRLELIDIGSTHSYVASAVSETLGIPVESTLSEVTVFSPLRVILRTEEDNEVVMVGEHRNYLCNVISALVAKNLVHKGCKAFLAYAIVFYYGDSATKDIRTVKDFSDVSTEKLPRLPSNRKVEFGIQILPGTALVSMAPYRMTPKEITKLKAQI